MKHPNLATHLVLLGGLTVLLFTGLWHFHILGTSGYQMPAHDNIPYLIRANEPGALSADFHTNASSQVNPRMVYSGTLRLVQQAFGLSPFEALRWFQAAVSILGGVIQFLFFSALLAQLIPRESAQYRLSLLLLVAGVLIMQLGLYAWHPDNRLLQMAFLVFDFFRFASFDTLMLIAHAQTWGTLLAMLGAVLLLSRKTNHWHDKRALLGGLLLLAGGLYHPIASLMVFTLLALVCLPSKQYRTTGIALLAGGLLPLLSTGLLFGGSTAQAQEVIKTLYVGMHPYHFVPAEFSPWQGVPRLYIIYALLCVLAALSFYGWLRKKKLLAKFAALCSLFLLACLAAQQLFVVNRPILAIIQLNPSRFLSLAFWLVLFCCCMAVPARVFRWVPSVPKCTLSAPKLGIAYWAYAALSMLLTLVTVATTGDIAQVEQREKHLPIAQALDEMLPRNKAVAWHHTALNAAPHLRNLFRHSAYYSVDFPYATRTLVDYSIRREVTFSLTHPSPTQLAHLQASSVHLMLSPIEEEADTNVWKPRDQVAQYRIWELRPPHKH